MFDLFRQYSFRHIVNVMELAEVCFGYLKLYFTGLGVFLIATYSIDSNVSIKAMMLVTQPTYVFVCVGDGSVSVSLSEHSVQFDSCHDNLNDLWCLSCR